MAHSWPEHVRRLVRSWRKLTLHVSVGQPTETCLAVDLCQAAACISWDELFSVLEHEADYFTGPQSESEAPRTSLYALAEQARGREHDPDDERGQAGKQQNFAQDSSHASLPYGLASPMRGSSWHIRGLAVGPVPDSGT
jgi:hypothetical protein